MKFFKRAKKKYFTSVTKDMTNTSALTDSDMDSLLVILFHLTDIIIFYISGHALEQYRNTVKSNLSIRTRGDLYSESKMNSMGLYWI